MKKPILSWLVPEDQLEIKKLLLQDGVLAGSSDTVLGLYAALSKEGFLSLNRIKSRKDKPYIILLGKLSQLEKFTHRNFFSDRIEKFLNSIWPGPVTLIVPARSGLPDYMISSDGSIAVRIPKHEGLQSLLSDMKGLFSTSANLSGQPIARSLEEIDPVIQASVVGFIGPLYGEYIPSTIIDCCKKSFDILRSGLYSPENLKQEFPDLFG